MSERFTNYNLSWEACFGFIFVLKLTEWPIILTLGTLGIILQLIATD